MAAPYVVVGPSRPRQTPSIVVGSLWVDNSADPPVVRECKSVGPPTWEDTALTIADIGGLAKTLEAGRQKFHRRRR